MITSIKHVALLRIGAKRCNEFLRIRPHVERPLATLLIALFFALTPAFAPMGTEADTLSPPGPQVYNQTRVIIRLETLPLVYAEKSFRGERQSPDLRGERAERYVAMLKTAQENVASTIQRVVPGAVVERSYQVTFNGLAVRFPEKASGSLNLLRALPGVSAVYEESRFQLALYSSVPAIGTEARSSSTPSSPKRPIRTRTTCSR